MEAPSKRWIVAEARAEDARALAERLKTSPLVAQLLINRGHCNQESCRDFLAPTLKSLHDPHLMTHLRSAAERIARAIRDGETIVIYGDYDVDGITATAILWHAITLLGGKVESYIPHRVDEGYGLNVEAIRAICQNEASYASNAGKVTLQNEPNSAATDAHERSNKKLIVTVDCGVTALASALIAKEHNVDLIITDHHEWKTKPNSNDRDLPDCHSIVHPRLAGDGETAYPNPNLCGAGVAFKLAWAVGLAMSGAARVDPKFKNYLIDATALAALGTIADVVPLVGENRVLAHFGLNCLQQSRLTGIRALIHSAGCDEKKLDAYHVGFLLAPRLNASGRLGHAKLAVEMMTTADEPRAMEIADFLEIQNRERQGVERQILEEALELIEMKHSAEDRAIVLGSKNWHAGVIGIVASRLVDRFHRPTLLVALGEAVGAGSGRSVSGFNLAEALTACTGHLVTHGGHEMAAGLKVMPENFEAFRQAFLEHARQTLTDEQSQLAVHVDSLAELSEMSEALVNDFKRIGPFGNGNRKPLLCVENVELIGTPKRIGKKADHLSLSVRQGATRMRCIAFGKGNWADRLSAGSMMDLVVEPSINEWNGRISVELDVKDLRISNDQSSAVASVEHGAVHHR